MKRYFAFPKTPALLEPHHQCNILPLWREEVDVFYSPSQLAIYLSIYLSVPSLGVIKHQTSRIPQTEFGNIMWKLTRSSLNTFQRNVRKITLLNRDRYKNNARLLSRAYLPVGENRERLAVNKMASCIFIGLNKIYP